MPQGPKGAIRGGGPLLTEEASSEGSSNDAPLVAVRQAAIVEKASLNVLSVSTASFFRRSPTAGSQLAGMFMDYMKRVKPEYSNFATLIEKSGFLKTLTDILQNNKATILVPLNTVVQTKNVKVDGRLLQRLGFHVLLGAIDSKSLTASMPGTKFLTCDLYPKNAGVYAFRLKATQFQLAGRPDSKTGAQIVRSNFFADPNGFLVAHGINVFLEPYRYWG